MPVQVKVNDDGSVTITNLVIREALRYNSPFNSNDIPGVWSSFNDSRMRRDWEWEALDAIGDRLSVFRSRAGLTQEKVAKYLNSKASVYQRYESGDTDMPVNVLISLCILYELSPSELLGFEQIESGNIVFKRIFNKLGEIDYLDCQPDGTPFEIARAYGFNDFPIPPMAEGEVRPRRRGRAVQTRKTSSEHARTYVSATRSLVGGRLLSEREKRGLTRADMAKLLPTSAPTYQRIEEGTADASALMVVIAASAFGISSDTLLGFQLNSGKHGWSASHLNHELKEAASLPDGPLTFMGPMYEEEPSPFAAAQHNTRHHVRSENFKKFATKALLYECQKKHNDQESYQANRQENHQKKQYASYQENPNLLQEVAYIEKLLG